MVIQKAVREEAGIVADLAIHMWDTHTLEELTQEFFEYMNKSNTVIFLSIWEGRAVGFAQCGLRHDYVEGTSGSPVGYQEGIFVLEEYRKKGIAKKL